MTFVIGKKNFFIHTSFEIEGIPSFFDDKERNMRKLSLYLVCWVLGMLPMLSQAQSPIRSFPYDEDFSANFDPDAQSFLPQWWWNKAGEGQLFQFNWQGRSDLFSLAMLPDGKYPVYAQVSLNLEGKKNMYVGFWVATLKNGGKKDMQRTLLSVSISTNGGKSFGFEIPVGPTGGFENQTTTFQYFQYPFPPAAEGQKDVVLRFEVWSNGNQQQPAILLLDDVHIAQAPGDVAPPFIVDLD